MRALLAAAALTAALPAGALAQTVPEQGKAEDGSPGDDLREMATDRPNLTDSPTTVDPGHVQIEFGAIDFTRDRSAFARSTGYSYADANVRIGVLEAVELNVIVQPHLVANETDRMIGTVDGARGFGEVTVGGKVNLWGNAGSDAVWATALGVKPQVKLPTAKRALGNGHVEVGVSLPFTMNLPAGFGLAVQPSLSRLRNSDNRGYTTGYEGAVALAHDVGPLNVYAEYVFDDTTERRQSNQQLLDLGATAAVTRNLVVDFGFGLGLNKAADAFRFLTGASVRF